MRASAFGDHASTRRMPDTRTNCLKKLMVDSALIPNSRRRASRSRESRASSEVSATTVAESDSLFVVTMHGAMSQEPLHFFCITNSCGAVYILYHFYIKVKFRIVKRQHSCYHSHEAPIAQSVEQLPFKETVPGSSPGGRTKAFVSMSTALRGSRSCRGGRSYRCSSARARATDPGIRARYRPGSRRPCGGC